VRQQRDVALWQRHVEALETALGRHDVEGWYGGLNLQERLMEARAELERVESPSYLGSLVGTIGADPLGR
jgi:hypothetical protein